MTKDQLKSRLKNRLNYWIAQYRFFDYRRTNVHERWAQHRDKPNKTCKAAALIHSRKKFFKKCVQRITKINAQLELL